jgi:hypothetical protein
MLKRLFWNILTGTVIPWIGVFLDKLTVIHMVKITPLFYGKERFIEVFKKTSH